MIGSGGLVVMDSNSCMVEVARFFMNFTQNESCGKCVPCREGTKRMLEILERIVAGEGQDGDIELLLELSETISATALCGLGKSASSPVVSTIKNFRNEYEAHIYEKRCPAGACQKLKKIYIERDACIGCGACARQCPVHAIERTDYIAPGKKLAAFAIDPAKCIKCGACVATCKFKAIKEG
jgi:NADH-quinone oxidoreductase subunit F